MTQRRIGRKGILPSIPAEPRMGLINGVTTWMEKVPYDAEPMRPTRDHMYDVSIIYIWKPTGRICDTDQVGESPFQGIC